MDDNNWCRLAAPTNASAAVDVQSEAQGLLYHIAYYYVMPVLICCSLLTNLLNMVVLRRVRRRQQQQGPAVTYRYLTWLALTELLVSLALVAALCHGDRSRLPYAWAIYYAHLEIPLINALTSGSVYIVVGLSVDRYVAVCQPRRYRDVAAPRAAAFRIAASLLLPLILYLPHFFYQEVCWTETDGVGNGGWSYQGSWVAATGAWQVWAVAVELCHRMLPASILVVLNSLIIHAFRQLTRTRRNLISDAGPAKANSPLQTVSGQTTDNGNRVIKEANSQCLLNDQREMDPGTSRHQQTGRGKQEGPRRRQEGGRREQEGRLVYLLVSVVTVFLATNLPAATLALIDTAGPSQGSLANEVLRAVANLLELLGFSLNFVLYFLLVPGVRVELAAAVGVLRRGVGVAGTRIVCSSTHSRDTEIMLV